MTKFAVVGAGLMGSAAAWQLAEDGHDVVLLERDRPANEHGSSHGSARILRYAYPQRWFAQLMVDARPWWDKLEAELGQQLLTITPAVDFGPTRAPGLIDEVLSDVGVEHSLLTSEDAHARWPQIEFDTDVVVQEDAAVLDAESATLGMTALARRHGAELLQNFAVNRVDRTDGGFLLTAEDGRSVDAERVVVAAGGWLPNLLPRLGLEPEFTAGLPQFTVSEENAFHFPFRRGFEGWPTMIRKSNEINIYALPGGRDAGFNGLKIAEFRSGAELGSAENQSGEIDPAQRERVIDFVKANIPGLEPTPYAETTCLFTMTPDESLVIDESEGVTIMAPCSGHGGKFAPYLGRIVADLATGVKAQPEFLRVNAAMSVAPEK